MADVRTFLRPLSRARFEDRYESTRVRRRSKYAGKRTRPFQLPVRDDNIVTIDDSEAPPTIEN